MSTVSFLRQNSQVFQRCAKLRAGFRAKSPIFGANLFTPITFIPIAVVPLNAFKVHIDEALRTGSPGESVA